MPGLSSPSVRVIALPRMPSIVDSKLGGSEMSKSAGSIQNGIGDCEVLNKLGDVPFGKFKVISATSTWKPVAQLPSKGATGGPMGSCIGRVRLSPDTLPVSYPPNVSVPSACELDSGPMSPQKIDQVRELIMFAPRSEFIRVEFDERPREFLLYTLFLRIPKEKPGRYVDSPSWSVSVPKKSPVVGIGSWFSVAT